LLYTELIIFLNIVIPNKSPEMKLFKRIKSLLCRIRWLSPLSGGYFNAIKLIIQIRRNKLTIHCVSFCGKKVFFKPEDELALKEVLVDKEYDFLSEYINDIDKPLVLDIGAHIGTFGIWLLSKNQTAQILSVEANPYTLETLLSNMGEYPEAQTNWTIIHAAGHNEDGAIISLSNCGPSMGHKIIEGGDIDVAGITLESLIQQLGGTDSVIDLVKIDIEGSEERFICERPDVLTRIRVLVIELHSDLCDTNKVMSCLKTHFDTIEFIDGRNSLKPLLWCKRSLQV
jgi:FkbM family methyltransferase